MALCPVTGHDTQKTPQRLRTMANMKGVWEITAVKVVTKKFGLLFVKTRFFVLERYSFNLIL